jgi:hypothetical protein
MRTVIIHGKRVTERSPRAGRPECDLWGVTRANCRYWHGRLLDWTEWVDVHPLVATPDFPGIPERRPDAWRWYLQQDGTRPIWLMAPEQHPAGSDYEKAARRFAMVPGARAFPIREIQAHYPINGEPNRWFVEQTGMMLAAAGMRGYERIICNGIGGNTRADWQVAHRSILYWIAFLRGRGVTVEIEGPSIYHTPSAIYSYGKFNYRELHKARVEQAQIDSGFHDDIAAKEDVNAREIARGRPPKFRIPPPEER